MPYYAFMDGLRAVAVLSVILFHFHLNWLTGGYVGVDVFFVISGFLITGIITRQMHRGQFSLAHFYERRARRILPALFLTCLICCVLSWWMLMPKDMVEFSKSLRGVAAFISNFIFARSVGYFDEPAAVKPLLHTWSLAVEEQFYLIFPPLFWVLTRKLKDKRQRIIIWLYAMLGLSLALNVWLIDKSPERTFYLLHTRAWELLAGAVTVLHLRYLPLRKPVAEAVSLFSALALLGCFFLYDRDTVFPGMAAVPPVLATVLLIWSNLRHVTFIGRILSSRSFVGVGLVSYGLYLYHWPVFVFSRYFLDQALSPVHITAALVVTAILSVLSYVLLEKPIREGRWLISRRSVFAASAVGLVVCGLIGVAGVQYKGFPARFDGAVLEYTAAADKSLYKLKCAAPAPENLNARTVCKTVGAPTDAPPDFLVWGDSHSSAVMPAIERLSQQHNKVGWFVSHAGCPSLLNVERTDGFVDISCDAVGDAVIELIKENNIRHVLLVSRWDMYALGWEAGGIETTRTPDIVHEDNTGKVIEDDNLEAFEEAYLRMVNKLHSLGVTVWVMKQVPPQLIDVPTALAKAVYFGRDPARLERSYADIAQRRLPLDEAFSHAPHVYYIDPAQQMCPYARTCLLAHEGHALYRDHGHLSLYGAQWLVPLIEPFFQALP